MLKLRGGTAAFQIEMERWHGLKTEEQVCKECDSWGCVPLALQCSAWNSLRQPLLEAMNGVGEDFSAKGNGDRTALIILHACRSYMLLSCTKKGCANSPPPPSETIIPVRINGANTDSEWGIMESIRPEVHINVMLVAKTLVDLKKGTAVLRLQNVTQEQKTTCKEVNREPVACVTTGRPLKSTKEVGVARMTSPEALSPSSGAVVLSLYRETLILREGDSMPVVWIFWSVLFGCWWTWKYRPH